MIAALAGTLSVGSQNCAVEAADKPDAPGNVKVTKGNYYKYCVVVIWDGEMGLENLLLM